jgi:uncharacterized protein
MDEAFYETTRVGLSYSKYLHSLTKARLKCFDYIEVPFELLKFDSSVLPKLSGKPIILHCASLSLGGYMDPGNSIKESILHFVEKTNTPWIGEHLAYITADRIDDRFYEPYIADEPYNIGYTVNPVMNAQSVDNIISNIACHQAYFNTPIIVENSPLYFSLPSSDMSQTEFINSICRNSKTKILLDLTHLYISSQNFSFDPRRELTELPLDRVVEVHVSGLAATGAQHWDNHASPVPEIIFELLEILLKNSKPKAITFEYNWTPEISWDRLEGEISRVKEMIDRN